MSRPSILLLLLCVGLAGCAAPRAPAGLEMSAPDEARAASLLAGYLLAQGWTVRLAEPTLVEATLGDERLIVEPLLDPRGLDRLLVSRLWPATATATPEALQAFALELNENLNVGQWRVRPGMLEFQASLPFLKTLDPGLLAAFLEFTAEVRFAALRVQGERALLAPVEDARPSR
jgi:hypothetical protein